MAVTQITVGSVTDRGLHPKRKANEDRLLALLAVVDLLRGHAMMAATHSLAGTRGSSLWYGHGSSACFRSCRE